MTVHASVKEPWSEKGARGGSSSYAISMVALKGAAIVAVACVHDVQSGVVQYTSYVRNDAVAVRRVKVSMVEGDPRSPKGPCVLGVHCVGGAPALPVVTRAVGTPTSRYGGRRTCERDSTSVVTEPTEPQALLITGGSRGMEGSYAIGAPARDDSGGGERAERGEAA